jgi:hypothetical protein
MGFLAPLAGLVGGLAGLIPGFENSNTAAQAAKLQNIISQNELNQKLGVAGQLTPFYEQYMQQGNPFLTMMQGAGAQQNAQQFGNAAGQLRGQMQQSGMGYGPSGTTASALGQLGGQMAQTSSSDYLKNLLQNEQMKFQAAQGLQGVGNMFNQQMPTNELTQSSLGSSVGALGQGLAGLIKQQPGSQQGGVGGPLPTGGYPGAYPSPPMIGLPSPQGNS